LNNPKITLALSPDPRTLALIEGKVTVEGYELAISHGEAEYETKRELMAGAYCLLAPITWPEPFGLFMIEAMACGTPVIAFDRERHRKWSEIERPALSWTMWKRWYKR
jgi:glycosyltransferase involved in cell wall biosynthesis